MSCYGIFGFFLGRVLAISLRNCAILASSNSEILARVLFISSTILKSNSTLAVVFIGKGFLFTVTLVVAALSTAFVFENTREYHQRCSKWKDLFESPTLYSLCDKYAERFGSLQDLVLPLLQRSHIGPKNG